MTLCCTNLDEVVGQPALLRVAAETCCQLHTSMLEHDAVKALPESKVNEDEAPTCKYCM